MEYRVFYNLLINRMDDWIIYGIKRENDLAYSYIKEIKKFISEAKKSNFKEGTNFKEISDIYNLIRGFQKYIFLSASQQVSQ
jgi:hypothetical protein